MIKNPDLLSARKIMKDQIMITESEDYSDTLFSHKIIGEPKVDKMSDFQKVIIGKNKRWGNILWLDNVLNVTEEDEFIYHEMIVHVRPSP